MLSSFKQTYAEIRQAVMDLDERILSVESLMALRQFTPVSEEIELLKEHVNNYSNLGKVEQYFVELMSIPRLDTRLDCWLYKRTFAPRLASLQSEIDGLSMSCDGVKTMKILEAVLAIGNYINGNTFRGSAYGFKLESLAKMSDVRSTCANKLSLMQYLANLVETKMPAEAALADDFPDLEETSKYNLKQMEAGLNALNKDLSQIDKELHNLPEDSRDPFHSVMQTFYDTAFADLENASKSYAQLGAKFKSLLDYFGEDANQESDVFFGTVYTFVSSFENARKENARRKALEKKAVDDARRADFANEKKGVLGKSSGNMDQLLDPMRSSGPAFCKRVGSPMHINAHLSAVLAAETTEALTKRSRNTTSPHAIPIPINSREIRTSGGGGGGGGAETNFIQQARLGLRRVGDKEKEKEKEKGDRAGGGGVITSTTQSSIGAG